MIILTDTHPILRDYCFGVARPNLIHGLTPLIKLLVFHLKK